MPNARSALTASPALAYTVERAPVFPSMLLGAPVSPSKNRSFGGFSPAMSRIKTRCSHSMPTIWAAVSAMKLLVALAATLIAPSPQHDEMERFAEEVIPLFPPSLVRHGCAEDFLHQSAPASAVGISRSLRVAPAVGPDGVRHTAE